MVYYDFYKLLELVVDVFGYGLGVVILYFDGLKDNFIVYVFRILIIVEKNYLQIEKEVFVIIFGVIKFYVYLYGWKFIFIIDYKLLIIIFGFKKGILVLIVF